MDPFIPTLESVRIKRHVPQPPGGLIRSFPGGTHHSQGSESYEAYSTGWKRYGDVSATVFVITKICLLVKEAHPTKALSGLEVGKSV